MGAKLIINEIVLYDILENLYSTSKYKTMDSTKRSLCTESTNVNTSSALAKEARLLRQETLLVKQQMEEIQERIKAMQSSKSSKIHANPDFAVD